MKLSGLGNLGMMSAPKARDSRSSSPEKSMASSFGETLGLKSESSGESKASPVETADADNLGEVHAESFGGDGIPAQTGAPALNGPVQERILTVDPDNALTASLLKTPKVKTQDDGIDSLTRRVVWTDFLRKMKEDLDIDAQDVLDAFRGLSDEELAQPPQETVNAVVANLGLDGSQAALARKYFNELVTKTKSKSMGEELETSGRQIHLTLMSQRDMQRKALEHSLERMNQNFWMKDQQTPAVVPAKPQSDDQMMVLGPDGLVPASHLAKTLKDAATAPQAPMPAPAPTHGSTMAALDKMNSLPQATPPGDQPVADKGTVDELVRQFLSPQAKVEDLKAGEIQAQPMAAVNTVPAAHAAPATQAVAQAGAVSVDGLKAILGDADQSQSHDGDEDSDLQSDGAYLNQLGVQDHAKSGSLKGAEFQGELAKAGAPQPMTVPELVDKAQIMLHDGGGEMKVTMSPDGLGEVAMRVSVHDGKVQVQMITESDEAKRMIERHVGDLKGQLSQNNLHIDSIKIDTATNLGKQLEQQYHDAQRQMAHQSLEQFRQNQQGWRRSFFEVPSARQYKGQADALRDIAAPSGVSASARKSNAKRRLDLVA